MVKLQYTGYSDTPKGRELGFKLEGFWYDESPEARGATLSNSGDFRMPAKGKGEGVLDFGYAKIKVRPSISGSSGRYEIELDDDLGKKLATYKVLNTGGQVPCISTATGYRSDQVCYYTEKRITGFQLRKSNQRSPLYGIAFVGKGWSFVEESKKTDTSRGYVFPNVALILVGPEWLSSNTVLWMCDEIKNGGGGSGGDRFY